MLCSASFKSDFSFSIVDMSMMEKKHPRNFSLDVHPYMLTIRKPKVDVATAEPLPPVLNLDTVYLEGTHTVVHVSGSITGKLELYFTLACAGPGPEFAIFYSNCLGSRKKKACSIPSHLAVPCIYTLGWQ